MIDKDDFDAWRDNPITQAVFKEMGALGVRAKEAWLSASWDAGNLDPQLLADLRATAHTCEFLVNLDHGDIENSMETLLARK